MSFTVENDQLEAIWTALAKPPKRRRLIAAAEGMERIATSGWASSADIEELLTDMDDRLNDLWYVGAKGMMKAFGIESRTIFYKPKRIAVSAIGSQMVAASDVAQLLIYIEQLGFDVDPSPLVERLIPAVSKQIRLTQSDLDVLWYQNQRHKMEAITLALKDSAGAVRTSEVRTSTGYRVVAYLDETGKPRMLECHSPKYRRRPKPTETKCEVCLSTWYRGDPESSASHRRTHKRRLAILEPKPNEKFLHDLNAEISAPELVTFESPKWRHKEIYVRAARFRREFGYDFVQWQSPKGDDDPMARGFLFNDDTGLFGRGAIVGACAFRWREWKDAAPGWGMQWIWVCPGARRKGVLRRRWSQYLELFGEFIIEAPLSEAMEGFARTVAAPAQAPYLIHVER